MTHSVQVCIPAAGSLACAGLVRYSHQTAQHNWYVRLQASQSATDDGFLHVENISSNATPQVPDEPEARDVSMPAVFAPSSQVSSARHELGSIAADVVGDAGDEEQGQAAVDGLQQDVEATLSLQPSSYEMVADGVLDVPSDIDVAASEVGQEDQQAEDRMENAAADAMLNDDRTENAAEDAMHTDADEDTDVASAVKIALQGLPVTPPAPSVSEMSCKTDPSPLALPENYQAEASTYCMVCAQGALGC
jgi:hypothetical protein